MSIYKITQSIDTFLPPREDISRIPLPFGTITLLHKISEGGFAVLYLAEDEKGKKYAAKFITSASQYNYSMVIKEYSIQEAVSSCKNIVKAYAMITNESEMKSIIIMEFCPSTLVDLLEANQNKIIEIKTIVNLFVSICEAVECMHNYKVPITHRDIKVENVLRSENTWKLCDFGSAITNALVITDETRERVKEEIDRFTTYIYRAPEAIDLYRSTEINTKYDIWSLGCFLYRICTNKDAFTVDEPLGILNGKYTWPNDRIIDIGLKDIVKYCLNVNPKQRPTIKEVLGRCYHNYPKYVDPKYKTDLNRANSSPVLTFSVFNSSQSSGRQSNDSIVIKRSSSNSGPVNFDEFDFEEDEESKLTTNSQASFSSGNISPFQSGAMEYTVPPAFDPFENMDQSLTGSAMAIDHEDLFAPHARPKIQIDPFATQVNQFTNTQQPQFDPFSTNQPPPQFDPFSSSQRQQCDPFAQQVPTQQPQIDPFTQQPQSDPFAQQSQIDPFAQQPQSDPYAEQSDPFTQQSDPFAQQNSGQTFDPFNQNCPAIAIQPPAFDPFSQCADAGAQIDVSLLETNQNELERKILGMEEKDVTDAVKKVFESSPNAASLFIFQIIPRTGTKVNAVLKGVNEKLCDPEVGGIFSLMKGIFEQAPGLRGNFIADRMDMTLAQPLLTLVDAVCITAKTSYIAELANIAAEAYNGAVKVFEETKNQYLGERLKLTYEVVNDIIELFHSPLQIKRI